MNSSEYIDSARSQRHPDADFTDPSENGLRNDLLDSDERKRRRHAGEHPSAISWQRRSRRLLAGISSGVEISPNTCSRSMAATCLRTWKRAARDWIAVLQFKQRQHPVRMTETTLFRSLFLGYFINGCL
jgi:hypothetical protein